MHVRIDDVIADGTKVVVRFTNGGTQSGPFMGFAPSGTHAEWTGIGIYNVNAGKITEGWFGEDILAMLLGLGVLSLPSSSSEYDHLADDVTHPSQR